MVITSDKHQQITAAYTIKVSSGQESETSEEWTEDEEEHTPLDPIDPFVAFSDALRGLQATNPRRFAALTAGMLCMYVIMVFYKVTLD